MMVKDTVDRKGNRGKDKRVQCDSCGRLVPISKVLKVRKHSIPLDPDLINLLERMGVKPPTSEVVLYTCISCCKHRHII
jgi:small subunit ribosomal protein S26e